MRRFHYSSMLSCPSPLTSMRTKGNCLSLQQNSSKQREGESPEEKAKVDELLRTLRATELVGAKAMSLAVLSADGRSSGTACGHVRTTVQLRTG